MSHAKNPQVSSGRQSESDSPAEGIVACAAPGDIFTITTEDVEGTREVCGTTFPQLASDVLAGDTLLIDDGEFRLRVLDTDGIRVRTEVALSFVRSPKDAQRARIIMAEENRRIPIIAKIEKPEAVEHLQEIIDAFDGIVIARGDLGVELPLETVPIAQKRAIELARRWAKPVSVATQMLESMIENPVPTRAETSDVANAVLDGADAVMLSGETSVGAHPVTVVETMARIVRSTARRPGSSACLSSGRSHGRRAER